MNDNQIIEQSIIVLNEEEKTAVSSIVAKIVELIKEKHL
jgi:hypothetical protein